MTADEMRKKANHPWAFEPFISLWLALADLIDSFVQLSINAANQFTEIRDELAALREDVDTLTVMTGRDER
jgi:hypothetical protein